MIQPDSDIHLEAIARCVKHGGIHVGDKVNSGDGLKFVAQAVTSRVRND